MTVLLVEYLTLGEESWGHVLKVLAEQAVLGTVLGMLGGRAMVYVLNRLNLAQGLHAPFVAAAVIVIFGLASSMHGSGFLAVYLAGLVVGNRPTRAHNTVVVFLDAVTWLAQIVMFVLLGLLVSPQRLLESLWPALAVAPVLMFIARPVAVFLCLTPFRFPWRDMTFIAWVGLRGAVGIFLASIPLLVGVPNAYVYFDIAFVVVLTSLLIQGWTIAPAARRLGVSFPRGKPLPRRVELDLPGQLEQEIVGYPVAAKSPYLRRGLIPSWAKPTLIVRDERILTPDEGAPVREGDYLYLLAPPEKARGARPLLRRHAAAGRARSAPARRLLRVRRRDARRAGRNLRAVGRAKMTRGFRSPISSPRSSSARRGRAISCRSVRSHCWRSGSRTAMSSWSACGLAEEDEEPPATPGGAGEKDR